MKKSGLVIIVAMILIALLAPWLAPHDPQEMQLQYRLEAPSARHPFGRDENGADVLSRVIYGARVSLTVAWSVALIAASVGLIVGSVAGYRSGTADLALMRVVDMVHAFPGFLLALALVAVLGPSIGNLILALSITAWTAFARLVRGEIMHLKTREFAMAAMATGMGNTRLVVTHLWPNLAGLLAVQFASAMAATIISESGLSFLGLGVPASTPTWGALLNSGRRVLSEAPHISLAPGLALIILVLGFNLFADGLRDALDPRHKIRS